MPEAVIVATGRSPIGRAFKGSLVDMRPDDLAAHIVREGVSEDSRTRSRGRSKTSSWAADNRRGNPVSTSRA